MDQKSKISSKRIAKFIAAAGVCSRRGAEKMIEQGRVKLNNNIVTGPAVVVGGGDIVEVDNKILPHSVEARVWLYYKPVGVVTSHRDELSRTTVFSELTKKGLPHVISVGRLDINSEGLLVITNSPGLAHIMESPKNNLKRTYKVRVFGDTCPDYWDNIKRQLAVGIVVEGVRYRPILLKQHRSIKPTDKDAEGQPGNNFKNQWVEIVLTEGKNREIRKVMEHFNLKVSRLIRLSFGEYYLGDLQPGDVIEV